MASAQEGVTALLRAWSSGDGAALRSAGPAGLRRAAPHRPALPARREPRAQPATHRAGERGLSAPGGRDPHALAGPRPFLRRLRAAHAQDSGGGGAHARPAERGGDAVRVELDESIDTLPARATELIALDDALHALAQFDARKARVVELRFFGGLSVEEAAEVLQVSPQTVLRDWKLARAWLTEELAGLIRALLKAAPPAPGWRAQRLTPCGRFPRR